MNKIRIWWRKGLSPWIKLAYLVLLANGLPAFLVLMFLPDQTENWFVWTIKPSASARLLAVMYSNAIFLVLLGFFQSSWARARITFLVIAPFSVAATLVTLFNLIPFLQHPWYHLTYWLTMYLILFFLAPLVFFLQERKFGGRLMVKNPLSQLDRSIATIGSITCGLTGIGLFIDPIWLSTYWPWNLTPLVGRILAVWFCTLAIAYAWTLWDGDKDRTGPIFWQLVPTGILMALVPILHSNELAKDRDITISLSVYIGLALLMSALGLLSLILSKRAAQNTLNVSSSETNSENFAIQGTNKS